MAKAELLKKKIEQLLRTDTRGLSIQEIAQATRVSRITAALVLAKLEGAGSIIIRPIGNCKLHYWKAKKT